MIVRPLRADEIELVLPIGESFGEEAGVEWNPNFFCRFWRNMYEMEMGVILGLFEVLQGPHGTVRDLVGSLGALITPDMFSGKRGATEAWWYVFPGYRQGHGLLLLDAYEKWAAERGAKSVALTHLEKLQPEKLAKLYELRGYRLLERNFRKEI